MLERINTNPSRLMQAKNLVFHPTVGRELDWNFVKKIADNLDVDLLGTFHAVEYEINGKRKLWLVDGKHRLAALIHRSLTELVVHVQIHPDVEDEAGAAKLFLAFNDTIEQQEFEDRGNAIEQAESEELAREIERMMGFPPRSFKAH